jgi:hypothetical protein
LVMTAVPGPPGSLLLLRLRSSSAAYGAVRAGCDRVPEAGVPEVSVAVVMDGRPSTSSPAQACRKATRPCSAKFCALGRLIDRQHTRNRHRSASRIRLARSERHVQARAPVCASRRRTDWDRTGKRNANSRRNRRRDIPDVRSRIERRRHHVSSRATNSPRVGRCRVSIPTSAFAANALKDRADHRRTSGPAITTICSKVNAFLPCLCSPEPCGCAVFGFRAATSNIPLWYRSGIRHRALERAVSYDSDGHRDAEDMGSRLGDTAAAGTSSGKSQTLRAGLATIDGTSTIRWSWPRCESPAAGGQCRLLRETIDLEEIMGRADQ